MQLSIKAEGKVRDPRSNEEKVIHISTGMIGPSVDEIVGAAMVEFVRSSIKDGNVPVALTSVTAELLDPEEVEPHRFKELLSGSFPEIFS